jgi:phage-related minor tail protein
MSEFDDLSEEFSSLNGEMEEARQMVASFRKEMGQLQTAVARSGNDVTLLERGLSKGLRRAFDGLALQGASLSGVMRDLAQSVAATAYNAAMKPVTDHFGSALAQGMSGFMQNLLPFQAGGVISQGRITPFAKGGVIDGASLFAMRGGAGLMGEAGPEAIMPLKRGADGRLGVAATQAAPVQVTMNISTPDAASFQRSQSQIAAQMSRALHMGRRNS